MKNFKGVIWIFSSLVLFSCTNNWHEIEIDNLRNIQEANKEFVEPFKLPKIQNVNGKYKFLNREGINSFGYVMEIAIDSFSKSKALKARDSKNDTVVIEGKKHLWGPTIGLEYKFEIQFQFYDGDNFLIYELKSSCRAETGKINTLQQEQNNIKPQIIKATKKVKAILYLKDYIQIVS